MKSTIIHVAWTTPHLLVFLIGFVLAIINWSRAPGASALAMFGLLLILLNVFASLAINLTNHRIEDFSDRAAFLNITGIARTIVNAVGTALLVIAVFVGRRPAVTSTMGPPYGKPPL